MCLTAAALVLSIAGFGLIGCGRETKETATKAEAVNKQVGGVQTADTQANKDQVEGGQEEGSWTAGNKRYKAALRLSGAVNDMGWHQSAYNDLRLLKADYGYEVTYTKNLALDDIRAVFVDYAASGYNVIVGHGYELGDPAVDTAEQYSDTKFVVTEGEVSADNVASYTSKYEEGGYTMGMPTIDMLESGKAGFIEPVQGTSFVKIMNGFRGGAKEVSPDTQVRTAWAGSFTDTILDKGAAQAMTDNGTDVIEHCANESGTGAVNAAEKVKVYAMGDSCDQNGLAPDTTPSSSAYHIPHVIEVAFKTVADGAFEDDINQLGMANGAVSVAPCHNLDSVVPDELKQKISDKVAAIELRVFEMTCDTEPRA